MRGVPPEDVELRPGCREDGYDFPLGRQQAQCSLGEVCGLPPQGRAAEKAGQPAWKFVLTFCQCAQETLQPDVAGRGANIDRAVSTGDHPIVLVGRPVRQLPRVDVDRHAFALARLQ